MLSSIIAEISFRQVPLADLITPFVKNNDDFSFNVAELLDFVSGKADSLQLNRGLLTEVEYNTVFELFSALGRYDLDTQLAILRGYVPRLERFYTDCEREEARKSGIIKKLGLACGVTVGIMLL